MAEQEPQFKSFEEAKSALDQELNKPDGLDIDRILDLAKQCASLLTSTVEGKDKYMLMGQQQNIHKDLELGLIGFKAQLLKAQTSEAKAEIIKRAKTGVKKAIDILSHQQRIEDK